MSELKGWRLEVTAENRFLPGSFEGFLDDFPIVIEKNLDENLMPLKDSRIFGEFRKMPSFCTTHFIFYSQPRCPKCLAAEASLQGYAGLPALQGRWGQLRASPDILDQDQFGVCGTTSIVYLLLWYQFARARELYKAALADIDPNFAGSVFTSAGHQAIAVKFKYLSGRYRLREQYAPRFQTLPVQG